MKNDILLGIGQVAKLLNYCDNWIRMHEKQLGLTPTFTGGGHRRFRLDEVLRVKQRLEEERKK
jgi:DNA-binding transcriptional MerR regulator